MQGAFDLGSSLPSPARRPVGSIGHTLTSDPPESIDWRCERTRVGSECRYSPPLVVHDPPPFDLSGSRVSFPPLPPHWAAIAGWYRHDGAWIKGRNYYYAAIWATSQPTVRAGSWRVRLDRLPAILDGEVAAVEWLRSGSLTDADVARAIASWAPPASAPEPAGLDGARGRRAIDRIVEQKEGLR